MTEFSNITLSVNPTLKCIFIIVIIVMIRPRGYSQKSWVGVRRASESLTKIHHFRYLIYDLTTSLTPYL